ncbi:hypothetical protein D0Z07_3503 [Hyphodiscus hymeniophilus]|uniref:NADH dehydrogenase [ubiquinone] 1 beta subcomplex subunit 11, mitochondrial n=1 Tax=Hyphodiscus hymeniophilus TaxID=353542 RepID=A0A9P6VKI8_9HELO|nr:hypothetical protein D0Z07_3503 [Hyphodiscus hymeniophilus]
MPTIRPTPLLRAANTISSSTNPPTITRAAISTAQTSQRGGYGAKGGYGVKSFSTSKSMKAEDAHAHEDHYDPPTGWLWGIKPGEKPEKEGWENIFIYGFFGSLIFGAVAYAFKPDTSLKKHADGSRCSIQTWALEEARRRLEVEGILKEPEDKL